MELPKSASGPNGVAVILAGAVTRGAFEAGALKVLAERGVTVRRIVAASSGALNGVVYAAGVRARRERQAAEELITLWQSRGGFRDVIHVNYKGLLRGRGLSDQKKLLGMLRGAVPTIDDPDPALIELHIIVAPLNGSRGSIGARPATTYTTALRFDGAHFDRADLREQVFTAAVASAAFPGLFRAVEVPGLGPCIDGGLVNSAPLGLACSDGAEVPFDAILTIAPTPTEVRSARDAAWGRRLMAHVIDMLFDERLYQDAREAIAITDGLRKLDALARERRWGHEDVAAIKTALGWQHRRAIPIIPIRPLAPLPGDAFTGFFDASARRRYVEAGLERANQVLDALGWSY